MFKTLFEEISKFDDLKKNEIIDQKEKNKAQEEQLKNKQLTVQGVKSILFTGRFQPFHLAHKLIAENTLKQSDASKLIIGVVRGKISSKNKNLNPLNYEYQKSLIKKVLPTAEIVEISNSFIPVVALKLREQNYEIVGIVSGDDRNKEYNTQFKYFEQIKNKFPNFVAPNIKSFVVNRNSKLTRDISATTIRKAIKDNDTETFKKMMPKELWSEWQVLKKNIRE